MNDNDISTAVSDYLKANDTAENARRSVTLAAGNDPDYEAELRRVSAKTGVPLDSVRAFPAEVKQQANLAAFDFGEMAQKFPATATFLGNLDNAKIAHDDVGSLTSWEGVVADKLIGLSQGLKVTGNFLADSMQRTFKGAAYNLPAGFWGAAAAPLEVGSQGLQSLGLPEWAANSELGQGFRWLSSLAQRSGNAMALPKPQGNIEAGLASGFESLGTNLPLLPLGIATQSYKLPTALMSAVTGGTSYMEATGKGASPAKAATLAVPDAAAEYVTEQYGMKQLFAIPGVQQGVGALLKGIANFAVKEGVGEQAATIWQDFNKWMVLNPDKSVNEFIAERPDAAIQTAIATVVGGGGQVALVAGVNSLVGNVKSAGQAGQLAETLGQLNKIAEAAKVVERDADTAQGFFQSVLEQSGGATEVWISPAALAQSGLGQRLAQVIPDVAQQIDAAVATGSDVRLPIADLMARMVGPELEALAPLVATEPGGFSQVAAQEYLQSGAVQEFQAEVEKALAERQDNDTFKASADAVRGNIKTQLDTAARFTPQVNDAYAGMVGSWYSTLAARLNMTPEQVFEMYPLKIGAESVAGAQFEQGGQLQIDTPEFRNWFGESKVVDAAGKPLVVYHGSPDTRFMDSDATFKSQKERFGFGLPEGAHWFASSEVAAKTYADPRRAFDYQNAKEGVIPAYLSMLNPMVIDAAGQNWRDAQRRGKTSDVIAEARSKGHDGVVIRNVKDNYNNGAKTKAVDTYVVFDSKQIKSAVGNRGTFDPNDPNILHQSGYTQKGVKRDDYTVDLFGVPTEARADAPAERPAAGRTKGRLSRDDAPGTYATRTELVQENTRQLGTNRVTNEAEAAQALAYLARGAVERFDALVTDKDGTPLAIVGAFKGAIAQASVFPATIVGEAFRINGAANIWFAHNHPSGLAELSRADSALKDNLAEVFRGSGIKAHGILAIAGKEEDGRRWTFEASREDQYAYADITRGVTSAPTAEASVPVVERVYAKNGEGTLAPGITSPTDAKRLARELSDGRTGVILTSSQNAPVAFVPVDPSEVAVLRKDGRMDALYRALSLANGAGAFIVNQGGMSDSMAKNLAGLFNSLDVRVLDILDTSGADVVSWAEKGKPVDQKTFAQQARGAFDPSTLTVTLLKGADLSTFLHESGHFFLEVYADLAALPNAPAGIQRDMQGLLDWFGVKSLAEWRSLDFEEKRSYHEQFARGFEAYLFEGKAPSIEVQGLFQRFRAWLLAVYKDLKALKVELTDEVRGVMDRMLATEEQIKLAEYGRSMLPLFETAEQAGMTPEEFAAYQSLGEEATANAIEQLQARGLRDMRWLHKARGRIIKALQKEAQATRREVEMDVRGEVMSQPIYRAWTFLTAKLGDDDQVPANKPRSITPGSVDETIDPLFVAIAKLGGINRDQLISEWGMDAAEKARAPAAFGGKTMVDRKDGRSIDEMGMALAERGYLSVDDNGRYDQREFEEKFFDGLGGHDHYSSNFDYDQTVERKAGGQLANPAALGAGRLDRASLDSMGLPPEIIQLLDARKMLRKDALHPDIVASMFGFTSGDELVRKLAAADRPNVEIAGRTDARMLQEHGELADTAAIEKAADEAIHNDARARFVTTEANALAKATGKRGVLAPAAKAAANAMIARLKLRSIRPHQYASAEVRAAKASAAASKAGDLTQAAAEKRNQLINTYATRAAYDALADVEAGLRYLKKFSTDSKTLDPDYAEQIRNLLERFDLRAMSQKAIDKRLALADWIAAQQDMGLEPTIPDDLVNEAFRKPYKELTVEEFRGLVDTVKQIEHLGRLKHKLLTAANNRAYEAVRDEIVASINLHSQGREANTRTPTTNLGRAVQGLKRFWASHIKAATWARVMDGGKDGGPMWEYFVRAANERGDMETAMRAEATLKLAQILDPVFKLGKMGGSGIWFPHIQRSLNREARLAIALNVGNEGNLQRLLGGENWTEQQLAPVLATITLAEWQAVQAVWDHFETYRPMIGEKEKRVHGKEPAWVDAGSRITAQLGLRGGYYPIKYDPAASQRAEEHADAESAKRQLQGAYTSATTRRSFTKARAEEVNGRPLLYTLAGLYSGVNDVIHDLAWHEWLIDTNRLLRSKSIDGAIREHYGPEVKQQFKTWSQDIAEGEKGADHAVDIALSRLRQGISAAGLGFNVMSAFIQPLGITQSITRVGAGWIGRGVVKYLAHPIDLTRDVLGRSTFMENRGRTRFRELNELRNQVQDQGVFNEVVGRYAYWLMMRFQQMVDVPTWWGAYEKAIAEGNEETRAINLADQAVIDSQGGGQTKDLSAIERGGPAQRLFTVFYSFMNTALNIGVSKTMSADTPAKRARLAVDYAMLYTVPAVLGYMLKAALTPGGGEDDPEKLARKLLAAQIDYLMGLMVVVREFAEVGKTLAGANDFGRDYTGPAGLRMISDTVSLAKQAAQREFDDAFRKAAINVIGDFSGLPAAQVNRTITGSQALAEGKTENPGAIVFGFSQKR